MPEIIDVLPDGTLVYDDNITQLHPHVCQCCGGVSIPYLVGDRLVIFDSSVNGIGQLTHSL